MISRSRSITAVLAALVFMTGPRLYGQNQTVGDVTVIDQNVPVRLVGYGIVVGLDGSGDRSFGGVGGFSTLTTPTVRSVANLLRRFNISIPPEQLRLRNVAAVLVTAEVSPYLRPGGRFEVQVGSIGDATSLSGGVLWTTPLVPDVGEMPVATAQGPLILPDADGRPSFRSRGGTSGRIPAGGVLEVSLPARQIGPELRLLVKEPSIVLASRVAEAINQAYGDGTAVVEDPGSVQLTPTGQAADNNLEFIAAVETLTVRSDGMRRRLLIDARSGTVVAGGELRVGAASVSHGGITLTISAGAASDSTLAGTGLVSVPSGVTVQEIAAGLHAAGAKPREVAAIFTALHDVGALAAEILVR